jgi:hypothetical protein
MKCLFAVLILALGANANVLSNPNPDFLSNKFNMIIYADGTPKEILDQKQPMLESWRENTLEIRNMCKLAQCNYQFLRLNAQPNRYLSTKCFLVNGSNCESQVEKNILYTLEELIHESDFATTITLGNEKYGLIGSCKTEDSMIVMEVDRNNLVVEDESDLAQKKNKL